MRVAILVSGLPPEHLGGAEIAALQIARTALRRGHEPYLVTVGGQSSHDNIDGVPVYHAKTIENRFVRNVACAPAVIGVIRAIKPEIVHAQSAYMAPAAIAIHLVTGVSYLLYERGGVYMNSFFNWPLYFGALTLADRVIAQTEHQKQKLLTYRHREIEVIPNGVDVSRFSGLDRRAARQSLNLRAGGKIVLAVGRLRPEKNMADLVRVAAMLSQYDFILVGDGPQMESLKALDKGKRVNFVGGLDNSMVPTYMAAADILVNTSETEGFPVSILEAMAAGLPIVAPRVCGIPEIVGHEVNGMLTRPGDWESTARAVTYILERPLMVAAMANANRLKAAEYSWDNVVQKLYEQEDNN